MPLTRSGKSNVNDADEGQKQPPEVFCKKKCSQKFCKIHGKASVPESLFQ